MRCTLSSLAPRYKLPLSSVSPPVNACAELAIGIVVGVRPLRSNVITDAPFDDKQRWIELGIPRAETRVVLVTAPGQEKMIGGFMNLSFATDDVEATWRELKDRGVEFVKDPKKEDWGTAAIFRDSEGNQFVLSTSKG